MFRLIGAQSAGVLIWGPWCPWKHPEHRWLPTWELEVRSRSPQVPGGCSSCGPCGGCPSAGDLGQRGGHCWRSGRTTECCGSHRGPGTRSRETRMTNHSSLREGQASGPQQGRVLRRLVWEETRGPSGRAGGASPAPSGLGRQRQGRPSRQMQSRQSASTRRPRQ